MNNIVNFPQLTSGLEGTLFTEAGFFYGAVVDVNESFVSMENVKFHPYSRIDIVFSLGTMQLLLNQVIGVSGRLDRLEV